MSDFGLRNTPLIVLIDSDEKVQQFIQFMSKRDRLAISKFVTKKMGKIITKKDFSIVVKQWYESCPSLSDFFYMLLKYSIEFDLENCLASDLYQEWKNGPCNNSVASHNSMLDVFLKDDGCFYEKLNSTALGEMMDFETVLSLLENSSSENKSDFLVHWIDKFEQVPTVEVLKTLICQWIFSEKLKPTIQDFFLMLNETETGNMQPKYERECPIL